MELPKNTIVKRYGFMTIGDYMHGVIRVLLSSSSPYNIGNAYVYDSVDYLWEILYIPQYEMGI